MSLSPRTVRAAFLAALAVAAAAPALAQSMTQAPAKPVAAPADPVEALLQSRGEAYHRAPDAEQRPEEVKQTQILNAEIAAQNDLAENQEQADRAAYDAASALHREELARAEAARRDYDSAVAAAADAQARYERERQAWEYQVRACQRGDTRACRGY